MVFVHPAIFERRKKDMSVNSAVNNEFLILISQLVRKLRLLDRDEKVCHGVTVSQSYTIETLARKGMLPMNELAHGVGVAVSTMTRICDVMVRDGIARRKTNPADRRQVCIELTGEGRDLAEKLEECSLDYSGMVLESIPPGKRSTVLESLAVLNRAVESVKQQCCG